MRKSCFVDATNVHPKPSDGEKLPEKTVKEECKANAHTINKNKSKITDVHKTSPANLFDPLCPYVRSFDHDI